jgi:hypothetical protein
MVDTTPLKRRLNRQQPPGPIGAVTRKGPAAADPREPRDPLLGTRHADSADRQPRDPYRIALDKPLTRPELNTTPAVAASPLTLG